MIEKIINILKSTDGITDYRLNITERKSSEVFFVHRALETVRATDTTDIKVTVFVLHDGKLGDATFSVYSSYDEEKIKNEIEAAKKKASLIDNAPYELPSNEELFTEQPSNLAEYDKKQLVSDISKAVFAASSYEDGSINALEIFIYKDKVSVANSRGVSKTEVRHTAMIEAIPTWNADGESVELYECHNFTEFDAAKITAEIDMRMREVRDRYLAKAPEKKIEAPVVLSAPELTQLFGELAYELNYAGVYNHSNAFSRGDEIQKAPSGDLLSVTMCGRMQGSVRSAAFDGEGCTLLDTEIIKDGVACDYFGSLRYASYLGEKPTGNLGCIRVKAGTLDESELKKAPYFRCASMSGLQLDIYNDYIGGEVRLAYYFDGEREIPVTGISISGKLSDALSSMRLSNTETVYENYSGPDKAVFKGVEII